MNGFKWEKKYLYWGITAFLVIISCIAFFWLLQRWSGFKGFISSFFSALTPFFVGGIISYLLTPSVKFFETRVLAVPSTRIFKKNPDKAKAFSRGAAVLLSIVIFFGIIAALFSQVIPQLYNSIESLVMNISDNVGRLVAWARKWLDDYPEVQRQFLQFVSSAEDELTQWAKNTLLPQMQDIVTSVSVGVVTVVKAVATLFIAVVVSIYLMFGREKFSAQGKKLLYGLLPSQHVNKFLAALRFTNRSFMDFLTGQLLCALIVGILCYIGCLLIGIKDSLLIAVLVGTTNVIPFFGPFIGAIPSALIVLLYSPIKCLIFIIFIIILQQIDGNILSPRILGNATGLSGIWVLFSIIVGAYFLGPIGMIIGVPLFAVIYAGIRSFIRQRLIKRGLPTETKLYVDLGYFDKNGIPVNVKKGSALEGPDPDPQKDND